MSRKVVATPAERVVQLDRPGVLACGPYVAGKAYSVPVAEAERLVRVKGFRYVDRTNSNAADAAPMNTEEH